MGENKTASVASNNFASRFGAIMAIGSMCVGLGNVWRFPYMVGAFGGGAFVVAYLICVVAVVAPLAIMEAGIGKGLQKGMIEAYAEALHSKAKGTFFGGLFSFGYYSMNFFYFAVVGASVYFMYVCGTSLWTSIAPNKIYDAMYAVPVPLALCAAGCSIFTAFVIYKGVQGGIEKASKVMMPLMVLFFVIAIVFAAIEVPDIAKGYEFMFKPDFSKLKDLKVWAAAMGQACFSIGVGAGCVLTYGSHLSKKGDVTLSMLTVCMFDTSIGVLAGMAIVPACVAMGLDTASGPSLIFRVLPTLFSKLPLGNLIGVLVFLAIIFAAITSAIAQQEVFVVALSDSFKMWTRNKACIVFGVVQTIAAVISVYSQRFFNFWNDVSGNYVFIVSAAIGAIVFGYMFGLERIRTEFLNSTSDIKVGPWFTSLLKYIAVPVMLLMMINSIVPLW